MFLQGKRILERYRRKKKQAESDRERGDKENLQPEKAVGTPTKIESMSAIYVPQDADREAPWSFSFESPLPDMSNNSYEHRTMKSQRHLFSESKPPVFLATP
jgi:hypothetical protein